jgi:hypothetical protein
MDKMGEMVSDKNKNFETSVLVGSCQLSHENVLDCSCELPIARVNCETILVGGSVALKANQYRALAIAEDGFSSATSVEGIGVDSHTDSKVHGSQGAVQGRYILHRLDGLEYLHTLQRWRAELHKIVTKFANA